MPPDLAAALLLAGSYCLGSVSPAYWVAKCKGVDLRQHGSGNLGATNAGRVLGAWAFVVVFICDVAKGAGPVLVSLALGYAAVWQGIAPVAIGAAAVLGHVFPLWHGFKGGKAVATSLGLLVALAPAAAGSAAAVFAVVWGIQRLFGMTASGAVGLASTLAAVSAPFLHVYWTAAAWQVPAAARTWLIILLAVLIVLRHTKNIKQLFNTQSKELTVAPAETSADAQNSTTGSGLSAEASEAKPNA